MGKARKASAAASAAAMHRAGFDASTFVGFDAFSSPAASASAAPPVAAGEGKPATRAQRGAGNEELSATSYYAGKHEDIKQAFKSLSKKDPQTKVKALQEIARLIAEETLSTREDAREALPHFLYHYLRLCSRDADHRVRERANSTLGVILARVPKLVSRFAGVYLGETLCCVGDASNADVSRAASELVRSMDQHLGDDGLRGLFQKHLESISSVLAKRVASRGADGVDEEIRDRIQASALGAIGKLPDLVPGEADDLLGPLARAALGQPVRWKHLLNSESSLVRGAAYEVVGTLAKAGILDPTVAGGDACTLLSRALVSEQEPRLVGRVVEALVTTMQNASFFEQVREFRKAFFPNLWSFLRRGARGSGRYAYPMLLPMLSLIPAHVWEDLGSEELANKWLEEVWSGMAAEEDLGPHGSPALLQAQLESIAFLLKHGRAFDPTHLVRPLNAYICETRRFRLGHDLLATLALALGQVPTDGTAWWAAVHQCLFQHLMEDATRANRVGEVLNAGAKRGTQGVIDLAGSLVDAALDDGRRCPSLGALDSLVAVSGATDGRLEKDSRAQALLAEGLLQVPSEDAPTPVQGIVQAVLDWPVPSAVSAVRRLGWLDQDAATTLEASCSGPLARFAAMHFGQESGEVSDFGLEKPFTSDLPEESALRAMAGVLAILGASTRPEIGALAMICEALLQPRTEHVDAVASETESWLRDWLVRVFDRPADNLLWGERAEHAWAHLVRQGDRGKNVFSRLSSTRQPERLVDVAMYVSEEVEDGCLGFHEPAPLLWTLVTHAGYHPEWREAILVPYIVQARFGDFVHAALEDEALQAVMEEAAVVEVFASASALSSYAVASDAQEVRETVKDQIVPAMEGLQLSLPALRTLVQTMSPLLQELGLKFDALVERCATAVLQHVPAAARDEAAGTADAFITVMKDHEDGDSGLESGGQDEEEGEVNKNIDQEGATLGEAGTGVRADLETTSTAPAFKAPAFSEGEEILYMKTPGAPVAGIVSKVHLDDPSEPYYTVVLEGREVQTIERHLKAKYYVPETLAELNGLLAQARRAGDHKESLRLMKLLPSLTPKPVDSEMQRREALAASKARRQRALEQMAQAQARRQGGQSGSSSTRQGARSGAKLDGAAGEDTEENNVGVTSKVMDVSLCRALEQFGVLTGPGRGARLGREELRNLLLVSAALEAVAAPPHLDAEDEDAERIVDKAIDLVLAGPHGAGQSFAGTVPLEALDLVKRAPFSLLMQSDERMRGILERIALARDGANDEIASALADVVEKVAAEEGDLARKWWSQREVLLEGLQAGRVADGKGDFPVSCWRALVALIREMRGADADEREATKQILESRGLVAEALRWSLLDETSGSTPDALRQRVGAQTMRVLPALSRKWFTDSTLVNRAEYARVRALMSKFITPKIVAIEVADIVKANREHAFDAVNEVGQRGENAGTEEDLEDFGQITVRASAGARMVTALYEKEDCSVEMEVRIPLCFPLENVQVECVGQVGISRDRWRRWVMQINTLLTSQDGTLLDALLLWKLNMDKELEGMEPCPICYAVVHANDQSFPRLKCSVCKNAYHSRCLVKWFRTSHKNECPMCKQPFEFE
ncbi:E3 ubiquitin-protein ligase listerin [Hondaea fermentalgiana]|uniref:E3 ubiquitin-protein ligase listerin n=1 Tax=Hondaea fermentalgiana TaxID=2315210 RepID=A0A2R5FZ67_9STRA|nr:E3 ubiquitin-protein ligase listerin [Hondaea fermentalgiana]|eukprot:GBG24046.1 E3 ubiquitin-protein ligase listerin [Hondaea fermentalgiana]